MLAHLVLFGAACALLHAAPLRADVAQAKPIVTVEFAAVGGGNQDRDLQYAPGDAGFRKALTRLVVATAIPLMKPGQSLSVNFEEITLAGSFEPWRAPRAGSVRFMTGAYPPRIALKFRWIAVDGSVIREGARLLTNLDYLRDPRAALSNDPLRFDKALLQEWLELELAGR